MPKIAAPLLLLLLILIAAPNAQAQGTEITLTPIKDNTLYEDSSGALSNGAGTRMFTGVTLQPNLRRALVAFDLSAIPPDSVIIEATLTLEQVMTVAGPQTVSLHRALKDWGEGNSTAQGGQGAGGPAGAGDATWLHTAYDTEFWDTPGGDYVDSPSASTLVDGSGQYQWTDVTMTNDVQDWVLDPSSNFGWIVIGNEGAPGNAKTFSTREAGEGGPTLTVAYIPDTGCDGGACVPAVSTWGAVVLALALLTFGIAAMRRRSSTEAG
jgi:hypothetical protein